MTHNSPTNATVSAARVPPLPEFQAPWYPRALRRVFSALLFWLRVRSRIENTDIIELDGLTLRIPPTVFHPGFYYTSQFLARHVRGLELDGRRVLEVGCGSGFVSLVAASRGGSVTAMDINETAVATTKDNAEQNGLHIRALRSDLFEALHGERFNLILVNPPFYGGKPSHIAEHAWKGGNEHSFVRRFTAVAAEHLEKGGTILVVLSTDAAIQQVLHLFAESGFSSRCLSSKRKPFETLFLFEFSFIDPAQNRP